MSKTENKEKTNSNESTDTSSQQSKKLVLMKRGDYSVHVLIEELKNIEQTDENKLPKPVVKIICLDKDNRTEKPSEGCSEITLNEHFYFEKTNLTVNDLDSAKVVIQVYDIENCKNEIKKSPE